MTPNTKQIRTANHKEMVAYDYENQAWIVDRRYVRCGHPEGMDYHCYGKLHARKTAVLSEEYLKEIGEN